MTRLFSGVILAAAALGAIIFLPPLALRLVASLVAVLAAREFLTITSSSASFASLLLVALTCWFVPAPGVDTVTMLLLACLGWLAVSLVWRNEAIREAAVAFVAPWYIGLPLGMLVAIHAAGGPRTTLLLLATVVVSDTAQYYTGRLLGRRPLAPTISPKKTIEGALGGVVCGTLFLGVVGARVLMAAPVPLAALGLAIVVLGICGDLFESRLKRMAGVKDSSHMIPGHGGILDRIDALLFATPAFYVYLRAQGFGG